MKKTKIICTVGPSTDDIQVMEKIIEAGMDLARFNFSHGTHEEHKKRLETLTILSNEHGANIATIADTRGPEMRLGYFQDEKVFLEVGNEFCLTTDNIIGNSQIAMVNYKNLVNEISIGDKILLSDGLLTLEVQNIDEKNIFTKVVHGGYISSRKRVSVPGLKLNLPFLSKQDEKDIIFAIKNNMDYIAASFVQTANDVLEIRKILENYNSNMGIIAKIENQSGVENLEEILNVSDGIMVARGDLGVEIDSEKVPIIQKKIIKLCNQKGKPVITATQMLESMTNSYRATRAEASDVANSIFDGTDAIMLSGETASGNFPVEAVLTMAKIAATTEENIEYLDVFKTRGISDKIPVTEAISHATVQLAYELNVDAILTITETGQTARMISKYRPTVNILAVSPQIKTVKKADLFWGVTSLLTDASDNTDEIIDLAINNAVKAGYLRNGNTVVVTAGVPVGVTGTTNLIKFIVVGETLLTGIGLGQESYFGKKVIIKNLSDLKSKFEKGNIAVLDDVEDEMVPYLKDAGAIITQTSGLTSSAAILGINNSIPVILGCKDAISILEKYDIITVDPSAGIVYKGKINVR